VKCVVMHADTIFDLYLCPHDDTVELRLTDEADRTVVRTYWSKSSLRQLRRKIDAMLSAER
jgi:hypothetical protein